MRNRFSSHLKCTIPNEISRTANAARAIPACKSVSHAMGNSLIKVRFQTVPWFRVCICPARCNRFFLNEVSPRNCLTWTDCMTSGRGTVVIASVSLRKALMVLIPALLRLKKVVFDVFMCYATIDTPIGPLLSG